MQPSFTCLGPDELKKFVAGDMAPKRVDEIEDHLSTCETCRGSLEATAGDHAWWQDIESALRIDTADGEYENTESKESVCQRLTALLGPTDDPSMLGRIGAYEIIGLLGYGGMGAVFKARDPGLNRYVAVKILLPHLALSGAARARFRREGQAAAAIIDDCVLPIYAVDEWQGIPYLVMQYTQGVSLQKRIQDRGPLELKEILRIGMQAARGLAAAHAQGLVHRDVKPSNILLDGSVDRALLTDFGLARAVDDASLTTSGMIAGTPQYMSPEQARAEAVDHRSDLFSLGSVMYAMCTGHAPFRAESSYSVLRLITDKEPRPIREVNPDVPDWLCSIIAKLMAKQAVDRFTSADQLAELLKICLAHLQSPTTTVLPAEFAKVKPERSSSKFQQLLMGVFAMCCLSLLAILLAIQNV
ncbi:MAG: serine/threonine protein kinase [Pirellula sp.]|jgi:serine/threonine protein kinase|nr:serine/threonine protein kinase [Pirellula sp.]